MLRYAIMIKRTIGALAIFPLTFGSLLGFGGTGNHLLASHELSLDNRQDDRFVNEVFKKNILLNLAYLAGKVTKASSIDWNEITKPFIYQFRLDPNKTFAFHEDIEDKYRNSLVKTTSAHFNAQEGFKTDGYLFGDGICHLASLIYWVAKDAGLETEVPTNHDFAPIPDIPKQYGVSIYSNPYSKGSNVLQNLYITNNRSKPISFKFEYLENKLKVSVVELN